MILVEQHIIKKSDDRFLELDHICFLSKNLYNTGLYAVRQYFFETEKYLSYPELCRRFVSEHNPDYYALPTKISQQTLKLVDQNFRSFFALLKLKKQTGDTTKVRIPRYLDKLGRYVVTYTKQAISTYKVKDGYVKLSGTDILVKTDKKNIQQIRLVHKGSTITIEVIYKKDEKELLPDNNRYCSIDLGVNNLATVGSNVIEPIIINGRPLKSINQYYNKRLSELKSHIETHGNKKTSKRIKRLHQKRNNKIKDYIHKSTRIITNHLVSNQINTLIIGENKEWKQEVNIGSRNNQNFVQIPFDMFKKQLIYKCNLEGINVMMYEESYTSKCSFLDNETVCKHEKYLGKRIKRGLFKSSTGKLINADLNGSLNILRKVVGEFKYPIEVCSTPTVLTVKLG